MIRRISIALTLLVPVSLMAGTARAQSLSAGAAAAGGPATTQAADAESLRIGPGDLLHVSIFLAPELDTHARVSDRGAITLPLAGNVDVSGLTPPLAARLIQQKYADGRFLRNPQVSVLVEQFATAAVSVLGEVEHPGNYPLATPRSVMDVLALAGGLTPSADRHIVIEHRGAETIKQAIYLPNNAEQDLKAQVDVRPGDIVVVPRAGIVYVLGDVGRPGGYVMQDDSALTVLQAIAMASGANRTAAEGHARLVRRTASGFTEISVPLRAMEKGDAPDMALQHDDILWVPFSYGKNLVLTGSSIVGAASSAAVYR